MTEWSSWSNEQVRAEMVRTQAFLSEAASRISAEGPISPAGNYCSPVGTEAERASGKIWPGDWIDATGYLNWYFGKWWHTGADLNLNKPAFDSDAHAPIYAIADGEAYAVRLLSGWEWIICIRHDECLSRYAHVESIQITQGQRVEMGQHIANIGNAAGRYPYHLHFDIARLGSRMDTVPGDWPSGNLAPDEARAAVKRDYFDPLEFLRGNR